MSSFKRRVTRILEIKKLSLACLLHKLSETPPFIHEFVDELTVNVTEMFRDPTVNIGVAIQATVVLIVAGAIAGLIPAQRAATIRPIEALREE